MTTQATHILLMRGAESNNKESPLQAEKLKGWGLTVPRGYNSFRLAYLKKNKENTSYGL
jgi:hypothetical protein